MKSLALLYYLLLLSAPAFAGPLDDSRFCGSPKRLANGEIMRRADVLRAFEKAYPCPAPVGTKCPGWYRDHVIPLACGGCDSLDNIQWMPEDQWRAKSLWERKVYGGRGVSLGCP